MIEWTNNAEKQLCNEMFIASKNSLKVDSFLGKLLESQKRSKYNKVIKSQI
jgi:hypothetical protein